MALWYRANEMEIVACCEKRILVTTSAIGKRMLKWPMHHLTQLS